MNLIRKEKMNSPIFGKYRIIKALGKGGSGEVFLAEHIKLASQCAIKRISKGNPLHEQLLHEAVILKSLSHPCIPVIYDFEEDDEYSYIIEQYIDGILLKDFVKQEGRLKESLVISIGVSICDLFLYLYSLDNPLLYLDLNPGNIILKNSEVRLIDFGACVYKKSAEKRKFSLGTKGFFAPELKSGTPNEQSDVYAIGALLYYMAMGGVSLQGSNRHFIDTAKTLYSNSLQNIIRKASRYHPVFRYLSVAELRKKLLEQNRKINSGNAISRDFLRVGIAGAQSRIGVTHLALLLTRYLNGKGIKSLYVEKNSSGHLRTILNRQGARLCKDGIWQLGSSFYLPFSLLSTPPDTDRYSIIIYDMGTDYREENIYKKADIRLFLIGTKDWEVDNFVKAEEWLKADSAKTLINFLGGKEYRDFCGGDNDRRFHRRWYRIPYEPNPFTKEFTKEIKDFLEEILEPE